MLKILKIVLISLFVIILLALLSFNYYLSTPINKNGQDVKFTITKGESVREIAEDLFKANLIKCKESFLAYTWFKGQQSKFQAGEHTLNPKLNIKEIVKVLTTGETLEKERSIKIIEGWNLNDIGLYLEKESLFKKNDFLKYVGLPKVDYRAKKDLASLPDFSKKFSALKDKPTYYGLEGYLFPDTYRIFKDATLEDVVGKILANLEYKITKEMRADITKEKKTIYEIITMASLIEKEVKTEKDMKIVSGILWKRIKNGQPLQLDATLTYVLGDNKFQHSLEETKIDSLYNTYKYPGLPPGPIANPGLKAIQAAIYPEETPYNYFLVRLDTEEVIYGRTFNEHVKNKNKYLK